MKVAQHEDRNLEILMMPLMLSTLSTSVLLLFYAAVASCEYNFQRTESSDGFLFYCDRNSHIYKLEARPRGFEKGCLNAYSQPEFVGIISEKR